MKARLIQASRAASGLLLVWGLTALFLPRQVADLVGLAVEVGSGNGFAEIGALHGGLSLALGTIGLLAASRDDDGGSQLFSVLGGIFFALALGRLFVMVATTPVVVGFTAWVLCVGEVALGGLYFLAGQASDDSV